MECEPIWPPPGTAVFGSAVPLVPAKRLKMQVWSAENVTRVNTNVVRTGREPAENDGSTLVKLSGLRAVKFAFITCLFSLRLEVGRSHD